MRPIDLRSQIRPVATPDGLLTGERLRAALRAPSPHVPCPSAVAVENTHNAAGGKVMRPEVMAGIVAVAREAGLPVHLDGARAWNAAAALGVPVSRLTDGAATVMVSFSKGLGCPVGSCLAFREALRPRAWEIRLAAAALYVLDHNLSRIEEDHVHAKLLADRLSACPSHLDVTRRDVERAAEIIDEVLR